jgi:hypothetical protein
MVVRTCWGISPGEAYETDLSLSEYFLGVDVPAEFMLAAPATVNGHEAEGRNFVSDLYKSANCL